MSKAFQFLMQHKERFPQLKDYDGFHTRFSRTMLLEHVPATMLDMLNHNKHLLELVVINMGASDFKGYNNSQQRANIRNMVNSCKALTKQVVRPTDNFWGFFPEFDDFTALVCGVEKPVSSKESKIMIQWMSH